MMLAKIYPKEQFWFVEFIDQDTDTPPATGIFVELQDARQAAIEWCKGVVENVAIVGKSNW